MAFEVTCGGCSGQLLVDAGGVIVECPLCGAHLTIPEVPPEIADLKPHPVVAATTSADSQIMASAVETPAPLPTPGEVSVTEELASAELSGELTILNSVAGAGSVVLVEAATLTAEPADPPTEELPINLEEQQLSEEPTQVLSREFAANLQAEQTATDATVNDDESTLPNTLVMDSNVRTSDAEREEPAFRTESPPPVSEQQSPSKPTELTAAGEETVPRQRFIMVAGYASAVTLALLYLLFSMFRSEPHFLESLPDLVPEIRKDGAVGMPRVLPKFDVAPGHELQLGQSQRFGNVRVTPLKVTRGPIRFVHMYGNAGAGKEASQPVLKLWLRFENVSKDQEFPPLDRALVFRRIFDPKLQAEFSLNFLCAADQRVPDDGTRYFVYDLPEFSEFQLAGQQLDRWLGPGEVWETYVPSQEHLAEVEGNWVWRVLFRKGLNRQSGRGVTTLIDVKFAAGQVVADG